MDIKKDKHDDHGHKKDKHDDHGHKKDKHDDHGHKKDKHDDHGHKKDKHDDHGHEGHAHGEHDPHIWLDPMNARVIIKEITNQLVKLDSTNAAKYKANSKDAIADIDALTKSIKKDLNKNSRVVVFHDAYQYFENRFGIKVLGALTVNTDVLPGAEQLAEIREVIEHEKVNCIFSEPQFNPSIIKTIAKDTNIKTGVLDPLGATLDKGKGAYSELLKNMSSSFKGC
jgi:ABC-type Zn2+ transport system, periplasmic component/surface adhesin